MTSNLNKEDLAVTYEEVRSDSSDTNWVTLVYEGNSIVVGSTGTDYEDFQQQFQDDERMYGYVRVQTGDEMSKRNKFALIVWSGKEVSPLKRGFVSTDQIKVKEVFENYSTLIQVTEPEDLMFEHVKEKLVKAGGADYGTGVRE